MRGKYCVTVRSTWASHIRQKVLGWLAGGGGNEEVVLHGYSVSAWEDEKILVIDSNDGCTTLGMYLMPLNYIHLTVKMVNFMLHIFYLIKKRKSQCLWP